MGFGVWGLGCRVWSLGSGVWGLAFRSCIRNIQVLFQGFTRPYGGLLVLYMRGTEPVC